MKELNNMLGTKGEWQAKDYLEKHGYTVLERNYKNYVGEIDIIAKKDGYLVFVEVKKRATLEYGQPFEAVTPAKQRKIRKISLEYLRFKKITNIPPIRYDVISIVGDKIQHFENAF